MVEILRHQPNAHRSPAPWDGLGADAAADAVRAAVRADPDYRPTPLYRRPEAAARLGLGAVLVKHEGARLSEQGLASFKAVGVMAAFARLSASGEPLPSRVVCASDGNFGRAVAWGARRAGVAATIFVPNTVSAGRVSAIAGFGARVVRVVGDYDRAMAAAAAAACAPGVLEMTDTGHDDVTEIPLTIQHAYGVIAEEVLADLGPDEPRPTHLFVPAGVGGLAAGLAAAFDALLGAAAPALVTVQPTLSCSLLRSLAAGALRPVPEIVGDAGSPPTVMLCLACETPSTTAWPVLRARLAHALAVADPVAVEAMRVLATEERPAVIAGESGAAAYGALLASCSNPILRSRLGLDARARVLVLVTEGATDPEIYARLVAGAARDPDRRLGSRSRWR